MKKIVLVLWLTLPANSYADFITGKISLLRNYSNSNTVFQLKNLNGQLITETVCLVEDHGNGRATTFQIGIQGSHLDKFYSHLLMAYTTSETIKVEFSPAPNNYCLVTEIYSWK